MGPTAQQLDKAVKIGKLRGETQALFGKSEIRSMKIRYMLMLIAILLCAADPAFALLKAGDQAPDFEGRTLDGQDIKLSDLKGKTLLIEMGTTWCPSCNELAHQIDGLRDYLQEKDVTFVSVYLADSANSIKTHAKDENLKPADSIIIDIGEARRNYSIFSIPRLFLLDQNFKVVFDEMVLNRKEIKQRIDNHRSTD